MNEWKIEIITASNRKQYLDECIRYMESLRIPEGYEVSFTSITGAASMTAAYNEAMHSSDAKYKIYIHQDTFLIYPDMLCELLNLFRENPEIGMAGVLGGSGLDRSGITWNAWNRGRTRAWNTAAELEINFQTGSGETAIVDAIDGMFMATQYDIEWREDIITGWDFYDISQSCEFMKKGYQVAVPYQKEVWCLHDCGHSKLQNYDMARKRFCEAYQEFGYIYQKPQSIYSLQERYSLAQSILELIERLLSQKEYAAVELMLAKADNLNVWVTELSIMRQIFEIRKLESGVGRECFFEEGDSYQELLNKYVEIKFQLRRIEYGLESDGRILKDSVQKGRISIQGLAYMMEHCICDQTRVRDIIEVMGE